MYVCLCSLTKTLEPMTLVWQGLIISEHSDDLETSLWNWNGSLPCRQDQWQGTHARIHPGNFSNYIDKEKSSQVSRFEGMITNRTSSLIPTSRVRIQTRYWDWWRMQEPCHWESWLGRAAQSWQPRGTCNHLLLSLPLTKQKLNLPIWSLTELDDPMVPQQRGHFTRGRGRETGCRRKSYIGCLNAATTHELSCQKTSLDFLHAAQGFNRRKQELPAPLKVSPKPGISLLPYFNVQSIQAGAEQTEWRNRLLGSMENWHEWTGREVTDGSQTITLHGTWGTSWSPLRPNFKPIHVVHTFPLSNVALGSECGTEPWWALD